MTSWFYSFVDRRLERQNAWSVRTLRSCVKVEVAVLGSPSLTVLMVSVDVKLH